MGKCPYNCKDGKIFMNGKGFVPCPHCMGVDHYLERTNIVNEDNVYKALSIPKAHWGVSESECISFANRIKNIQQRVNAPGANALSTIMLEIATALGNSTLFCKSVYLFCSYLSIESYVYSCQVRALIHSIGTVPYITLNQLSLLLFRPTTELDVLQKSVDSEELSFTELEKADGINATTIPLYRRMMQLCSSFDYMDYITAPLVFLEASAGTKFEGWITLRDLLSERARRDLPTYIIGSQRMHTLSELGQLPNAAYFEGTGLGKLEPFEMSLKKSMSAVEADIRKTLETYSNNDIPNIPYGVKAGLALDALIDTCEEL